MDIWVTRELMSRALAIKNGISKELVVDVYPAVLDVQNGMDSECLNEKLHGFLISRRGYGNFMGRPREWKGDPQCFYDRRCAQIL